MPSSNIPARNRRTFIVKSIDAVDARTLVIPSQKEEILRIFDLVSEQEANGLRRELPPIHVIPEEEVIRFRRETSALEQSYQIEKLAVSVTYEYEY